MDLGIVGIVELLQQEPTLGRSDLLGLADGASHALGRWREDDVGAEGLEEHAAFHAHALRHRENELVPLAGGHHGQPDAGVSAGGLHEDGLARRDVPAFFCLRDHAERDAVLDGIRRVGGFQLAHDLPHAAFFCRDGVQLDHGRVSDQLQNVLSDVGGRGGGGSVVRGHRERRIRWRRLRLQLRRRRTVGGEGGDAAGRQVAEGDHAEQAAAGDLHAARLNGNGWGRGGTGRDGMGKHTQAVS
mmetsp:Transcript_27370/g.76771  ORF Transcript_27370/g.76771 Transcript_27370/m.76771 type:complete len:243 (+) Transcript_27370:584-1312(+)